MGCDVNTDRHTARTENVGTHILIALMHAHTYPHAHTDTLMSDMKVYRKPLSLKDNKRHKNKNTEQ